jgi:cell filamentation protein
VTVTDSPNAFGGVAEPLRHAINQAVAAERLEGWQPNKDHLADLVALAGAQMSFGDYLARYLKDVQRIRDPRPRRIFRRRRPYLIPGTSVLRNSFGVFDAEQLRELEFVCTAARLVQWHITLIDGDVATADLDVGRLHQHVFADVYAWAGNYRTVELRRGDTAFAWQSSVAHAVSAVEHAARQLVAESHDLDIPGLAYEMSGLYAEYNRIHPFREGNGRTGTVLLHTLATLCGRRLDLGTVARDEWYRASWESMPTRREGRAGHRPFLAIFGRALR